MILTCPACATRFLVPDAAFGPTPATRRARRVRCGKCHQDWYAEPPLAPPEETSAPLPNDALDMRAEATTDSFTPAAPDVPVSEPIAEPRPIPAGSNLPVRQRKFLGKFPDLPLAVRRFGGVALLAVLTTGLSFALYGTLTGRLDGASKYFPAFFHPAAPELAIENVTTRYVERTSEDAAASGAAVDNMAKSWALVVEGTVRNTGHEPAPVPPLLLATRDAKGVLLAMAHPSVQQTQLDAGAVTGFTATLTNVSDKVAAVTVQFGALEDKTGKPKANPSTRDAAAHDNPPPPQPDVHIATEPAAPAATEPEAAPEAAPEKAGQP